MKKYIIPAINVADIENEVILAGSNFDVNDSDNDYTQGDFGARERSMFDWGAAIEGEE